MSIATTPGNFTDGTVTATDDAANSESLTLILGDFAWSNLKPDGREAETYESQGALTDLRKGARAYPSFSVSAQSATLGTAFEDLVMGETAGFASTTAGIGDYPTIDLSCDFSYSSSSRIVTADDCVCTAFDFSQGSPSTVKFTFEVKGPLVIDGTTYVSSR